MNDKLIIILVVLLYFSPVFFQIFLLLKESKDENKKLLKRLLRFTKYSFLILILTSIIFGILSHTNFLNYEKPLTFDKYEQITFQNFRGLEFFKKTLYGNKRFAYVVTSIDHDFDDNSVIIQSLFYPSRSFVYNNQTNSKELLSHEKYHIKITELFVRKAKEKISNLNTFDKKLIKKIITETKIKESRFQKQYDYDTFHSYVFSEQKRYEKKVDSLLNLLSKFNKPKIRIND